MHTLHCKKGEHPREREDENKDNVVWMSSKACGFGEAEIKTGEDAGEAIH